ncbi:MAG: polyprenyl synthetase family protein [Ardenticatenaceae bacterium]|nr:polyprenyl synthetase family protein [Anaerolineales bacterium]MCB9009826.1 polyprenyl synthetase family protein [Ardenticatenaceae bacterium]
MNEFKQLSQEMRQAINAEMKAVLNATDEQPDLFHGMMHYHMGWRDEQLQPAEVHAGKQIRPVICLLACQAAGGNWEQAVPAAAAIELLHNFSLIHDDIEDASPTRRGRKTLWTIWGVEQAINAGDAMFAMAHLALNRLVDRGVSAETAVTALRRFDETCVRLTQGQHADMDFETREDVSVDEYLAMITGKTAVLLSLCTELGALIAGCSQQTVHNYAQFGLNLGLAFQVIDDILGIWGDEAVIGKSASTDILTKKKTLPVLYGLNQNGALRQLYQQETTDEAFVREAITVLNTTGARDYASQRATYYSQNALQHLEEAQPSGPAFAALNQLSALLLQRDY